jgi:dienelactone hydrolase
MAFEPNHTASAVVVRHPGGPRPWVIAVHGFCMGFPFMDFPGLHTAQIHRTLGMNVALPALPLHGPRRVTLVSGEPFLSFELMNAVHGLTQAVWDIRRLIHWVRGQGATSISLYGVSLGAYTVSLLAGLEDGVDAVVAGIPVSDFPGLFHEHSPGHIRARSIEHKIMGGAAENVYRVVSPLSFEAKVPTSRRSIFAGYGDRLASPEQAQRLWEHWDQPRISWYSGNHVGYLWSKQVSEFLVASLREGATTGTSEAVRG